MTSYRLNNLAITIEKEGAGRYTKASYPIRFGKYSEIKTSEYEFQFNLKGEIKFIRGLNVNWPHPSEWLKRTDGNDWVFYSVGSAGGHNGIFDCLGEYYLPCLPYPSNSVWEFNPFTDSNILKAFAAWSQLYASLSEMRRDDLPSKIKDFLSLVSNNDENALHQQVQKLHAIVGGRVSVLPLILAMSTMKSSRSLLPMAVFMIAISAALSPTNGFNPVPRVMSFSKFEG